MTENTQERRTMRLGEDNGAARWTRRVAAALGVAMALGCGAPRLEPAHAPAPGAVTAPAPLAGLSFEEAILEVHEPADARVAALGLAAAPVSAPEAAPRPAPAQQIAPARAFFGRPDAPILEALSSQPIAAVERGRGGRSLGFRLTFADGSRGYFKPDQEFNGMSWNAEIAAYHLDRELGLGRVAPVVSRRVPWSALRPAASGDGRIDELHVSERDDLVGAVIYWVPERLAPVELPAGWERWLRLEGNAPSAVTPFQRPGAYARAVRAGRRTPMPTAPSPDTAERPLEMSDLVVFDYLTNNLDRWGGHNTNIRTVGAGGPLMFLDNAASFTLRRPRNGLMDRRLHEVQRFRRSTIEAIRALDVEAYGERINADPNGPILDATHLRNLELRRAHLLAHVDALVAEHGEAAVLLTAPR